MLKDKVIPALIDMAKARYSPKVRKDLNDEETKMQRFFNSRPFDIHSEKLAQLVGLMSGFTPDVPPAPSQALGAIYKRNGITWMVLSMNGLYGFASLNSAEGYLQFNQAQDKLATEEEATKWLDEVVSQWSIDQLIIQLDGKIGGGTFSLLVKSI